jgi:hypothetical protein
VFRNLSAVGKKVGSYLWGEDPSERSSSKHPEV